MPPGRHTSLQISHSALPSSRTGSRLPESLGYRDLREQEDLAVVAEIGERPDRNAFGHRPQDRTGREARGQLPVDARRHARVARILPVGVPARLVLETQRDEQRLPGADRGLRGDQFDFGVGDGNGRCECRDRHQPASASTCRGDCESWWGGRVARESGGASMASGRRRGTELGLRRLHFVSVRHHNPVTSKGISRQNARSDCPGARGRRAMATQ